MKGIRINNIHSFQDLGFMLSKRNISIPKQNRITETVPYQNGEYDFSNLNGEPTYQNRIISYTFDIGEFETTEMENQKRILLDWAIGIIDKEIYDDYIEDFHFFGSFSSCSWSEDFGQAELTIEFSVYPYMYANSKTTKSFEINGDTTITLNTESSHRIIPTISSTGNLLITKNNSTIAIAEGDFKDVDFYLERKNQFQISGTGTLTFSYTNEVL